MLCQSPIAGVGAPGVRGKAGLFWGLVTGGAQAGGTETGGHWDWGAREVPALRAAGSGVGVGGSQSGELPNLRTLVGLGYLWGPTAGGIRVHGGSQGWRHCGDGDTCRIPGTQARLGRG